MFIIHVQRNMLLLHKIKNDDYTGHHKTKLQILIREGLKKILTGTYQGGGWVRKGSKSIFKNNAGCACSRI